MLCAILAVAMIISVISAASTDSMAKAKKDTIQYNNKVFTKKLYKNTEKIGFGPDGSRFVKDKKTIKKVYKLLAKMELKTRQPKPDEEIKVGFVSVSIYTKDGKLKKYSFTGDNMNCGTKKYTIIKNYPIDKIRKIYDTVE